MPSRGSIHIDGQPVTGPLKISGMAFQAPSLLPWRTTLDNVLLPLEIVEPYRSTFQAQRDEYVAKARKLLQSVGLGGYEDKFPWQLSGGMQQRASICRALVHEPKMLLLDEPFGALDAFTREELWCTLRDLQAAQKFNVILVTHDLRESVFLADTVYVMSKSPGRIVVKREIDLPRPRDLEITYTAAFTDIVHELRGHIGAMRKPVGAIRRRGGAMNEHSVERWAPLILLVAILALWQFICTRLQRQRVHLPQPLAHRRADLGVHRWTILGHAWRTYWVTMVGFGLAIVVGVLLGFLIGSSRLAYDADVPADDRLQRAAQGGLRADPGGVVRHRRRAGDPDRVPDLLLPDHGEHRHRPGHAGTRTRRRAAGAGRQALGRAGEGRPAALDALLLRSLKVAITLAFVGTTVSEMTAGNEGIGYLLISAGSSMQMGLAFAGLVVVGAWRWPCTSCSRWSRSAPPAGRTAVPQDTDDDARNDPRADASPPAPRQRRRAGAR